MQEITNQVYLNCVRTAVEITEKMTEELLDAEFKHMDIETKRSICSQYLAKQMYDEFFESSKQPTEEG